HHVRGRLVEIDRTFDFVQRSCLDGEQMHGPNLYSGNRTRDGLTVEPLLTDNDQTSLTAFVRPPCAIELMLQPRAHALYQEPHRLTVYLGKPFDAQDVVRGGGILYALQDHGRIVEPRHIDDERFEIVVV